MKVILHIDFDSYFVSAERTLKLDLINKPVVVSFNKSNSIIVASSYEAKKYGINAPMLLKDAKKLFKNLIVVNPNHDLYSKLSNQIFTFIKNNFTKKIQIFSIDECFLDVSNIWSNFSSPKNLALKIQNSILEKFKIPISIGISNSKFIAKMSTSLNKPFGITITKPDDFLNVFGSKKIINFFGIGKKTALKLNKIGIKTILDLAQTQDHFNMQKIFGKNYLNIIQRANGIDVEDVSIDKKIITISKDITFSEKDFIDRKQILFLLKKNSKLISFKMKKNQLLSNVFLLKIKTQEMILKQKKIDHFTNDENDIFNNLLNLFDDIWDNGKISFISFGVANLQKKYITTIQNNFFEEIDGENISKNIVKKINQNFDQEILFFASDLINN